jgi:apolipoprotein N-acyltransferase
MKNRVDLKFWGTAFAAVIAFILLSPKWTFPLAAFVAPGILIHLIAKQKFWKSFLIALCILFVANLVANFKVIPFPTIISIPIALQTSILAAIPYLIYSRISRLPSSWVSTLYFPILQVLYEFVGSFMGAGTWGSIVYTQMDNLYLIQLGSVTGMWGIAFIIYWCSSLLAYFHECEWRQEKIQGALQGYAIVFLVVLMFGVVRLIQRDEDVKTVKVSGITGSNLHLLGTFYEDAFNKRVTFDPAKLTQTSPELQELNKGIAELIADPLSPRFTRSQREIEIFQDSMFSIASREAKAGAKIISFSEALMFTFKPIEDKLIKKGQEFSRRHKITLLLTVASFIPGKVEFGSRYIENKAIVINPLGQIEHTFFKNKPVPVIEPSIPGNGEIPVYNSIYGRIATSICYDADFPSLIRKAGKQCSGILLLPSGDWREISPYHGNMARMRAIENGFSIVRPVSGASSIICDRKGRILATRDFYSDGDKIVSAYVDINGSPTLYSVWGDFFPWLALAFGIGIFLYNQIILRGKLIRTELV